MPYFMSLGLSQLCLAEVGALGMQPRIVTVNNLVFFHKQYFIIMCFLPKQNKMNLEYMVNTTEWSFASVNVENVTVNGKYIHSGIITIKIAL